MQQPIYLIHRNLPDPGEQAMRSLKAAFAEANTDVCEIASPALLPVGGCGIAAGTSGDRMIQILLAQAGKSVPLMPEEILICRADGLLVAAGADERGLCYALCELADAVRAKGPRSLWSRSSVRESPANRVRGVDRYLESERDMEEWFLRPDFWTYFIPMLARRRFNRFTLILGFDTAYMAPVYPYLFKIPGYETVSADGVDDSVRARNMGVLRHICALCKAWGVEFIFSVWQQVPWTKHQNLVVHGLPEDAEALADCCAAGIRELLRILPDIGGVQFRVNMESGVRRAGGGEDTDEEFWRRLFDGVADCGRKIKLEPRAKGLTPGLLEYAAKLGVDVTVPTKYWCEHAALPYHITQLRAEEWRGLPHANSTQRYSYGDLLRRPRHYDVLYRLWNYGSTNVFLWGDADYARRFSISCVQGDSVGFQINSPLSMKGGYSEIKGSAWPIHVHPAMRDYGFEDERYWLTYLVFGRWGYNPDTSQEIVLRELAIRYGAAANDVWEAYRIGGKIIPLITTAHMPCHPSMIYWPELHTGAPLFVEHIMEMGYVRYAVTYGSALASDEALFYGVDEYAAALRDGDVKARYTPLQVRDWYKALADGLRACVARLNAADQPALYPLIVDFSMLCDLVEYHAWKVKAAWHLALFRQSEESGQLLDCYQAMCTARMFWASLAESGERHYHRFEFDLAAPYGRFGTWRDRLENEIDRDLDLLTQMLEERGLSAARGDGTYKSMVCSTYPRPLLSGEWPDCCAEGEDLEIELKCGGEGFAPVDVRLHYRHMNHLEAYVEQPMYPTGTGYTAVIPGEYITAEFPLIVYCTCMDHDGNPMVYPGVFRPESPAPYKVIRVLGREFGNE